jgi:hypothetical protein
VPIFPRYPAPLGWFLALADEGRDSSAPVVYVRGGRRAEAQLWVAGYANWWPALFASFVLGATCALGFFLLTPLPALVAGFYGFITLGIWLASRFGGPPAPTPGRASRAPPCRAIVAHSGRNLRVRSWRLRDNPGGNQQRMGHPRRALYWSTPSSRPTFSRASRAWSRWARVWVAM